MRASFEKRDQDAKNSAYLRQRISRRSTTGTAETSVTRIPKSASFSDLQDPQLNNASSAFPSSNPQPDKHHKSKPSKNHQMTPPKERSTSAKGHKEPVAPKQAQKSSFMKWLKEPFTAVVSSIMHSGSYKPKDQTDCGIDEEAASYKPLPAETCMSTTLPDTPSSDQNPPVCSDEEVKPPADRTLLLSPNKDVTGNSSDSETALDESKESSPEKQDEPLESTAFTSQESPSTEDQVGTQEEDTTKGDIDVLDDVRVRPLIAKLEPTTVIKNLTLVLCYYDVLLQENDDNDVVMVTKRSSPSANQLGILVLIIIFILLFYIQYYSFNSQHVYINNNNNILVV